MPGESPGRDWDALLSEPEPDLAEVLAAARARHRRKQQGRAWAAFAYLVLGSVFVGWSAGLWWVLGQPHILLVPWVAGYGVVLWLTVVVLRRIEDRVLSSTQRELELEE